MTLRPVHRDRYFTPTDRGIKRKQVQETLSGLSSIKPGHAKIVRHVHTVPDPEKKGSYTEANMLITTRGTVSTPLRRSIFTKDVRQ